MGGNLAPSFGGTEKFLDSNFLFYEKITKLTSKNFL